MTVSIEPGNFRRAVPCALLLAALLLAGCGTTVSYKSNTPAGPPRPPGYPIPVYMEDETAPRPTEVIGTVSVSNTGMTVTGGSVEDVMKDVMTRAREYGADAVHVTDIGKPDVGNPNYRMTADLLRYTDKWETIGVSEDELAAYLQQNKNSLDPIEGIWVVNGQFDDRIGIMRNDAKPGRDFVAFVLATDNPSWRAGYKVMDIVHGKRPDIYNIVFYHDDFSHVRTSVVLGKAAEFSFLFESADNNETTQMDFLKR